MVVDDHPAFREGLSRLFQEEKDLKVIATTGDGGQAVELAAKLKPDVIIMDICLDGINGIEATRIIKDRNPETEILIVSAFDYSRYILAARSVGAAGYLLKNTQLPEIIKRVRSIFSNETGGNLQINDRISCSSEAGLPSDSNQLHAREIQVLNLLAEAKTNKEIAICLAISERTVQTHLVNIFHKLHVESRTEAVLQGIKQGWLSLDDLPDN